MKCDLDLGREFWDHFFKFVSTSINFEANRTTLGALPEELFKLEETIRECESPKEFIDFGPEVRDSYKYLDPTQFSLIAASAFIAHRYERIRLARDFMSSWTRSIVENHLITAALLSRAMTEFAADMVNDCSLIGNYVKTLTHKEFIAESTNIESKLFEILYTARYAGRIVDYNDPRLKQQNILGAIKKLPEWVQTSYDELSEICHPNASATQAYWKVGNPWKGELAPIEYVEDLLVSQSPYKIQIAAGPLALAGACPKFSTLLWGFAQCIAGSLKGVASETKSQAGIPPPLGRNDFCFCNSGLKHKNCPHPNFFLN